MPTTDEKGKTGTILSVCYHCGTSFHHKPLIYLNKDFCCSGCQSVFTILEEKGLCKYYELNGNKGSSLAELRADLRFGYLEDPAISRSLLSYYDDKKAVVLFEIPQMHCSACIYLLENLFKIHKGVYNTRVNFPKRKLKVEFNPSQMSVRELVELLASLGYEPQINMSHLGQTAEKRQNRQILYKIGIAGFCFGNLMLLGFPEYLADEGLDSKVIQSAIQIISILLAIPVVTYVSMDYYKSAIQGIKQRYLNIDIPISLGILALFIRSLYEIISHVGPGYLDSLGGLLFFLMCGKFLQQKTYSRLTFEHDYKSFFPLSSIRIERGMEKSVPVTQLVPGDSILVRNQEILATDSVLVSDKAMVDYSFVTGESNPVEKFRGDVLFAGGKVVGNAICAEVLKMASQSYLTQLWNDEAFTKESENVYRTITDRISQYFTPAVLIIASAGFFTWSFFDMETAFKVLISVLIIACPCALALSAPFTFGTMVYLLGQKKVYLKNVDIVDKMSSIDTLVFDKTGTLTQSSQQIVDFSSLQASQEEKVLIKSVCRNSTHPLGKLIYQNLNTDLMEVDLFDEVKGKGIMSVVGGKEVLIGSADFILNELNAKPQPDGTSVFVKINNVNLGSIRFHNQYREGIQEMADRFKNRYNIVVLSGDTDQEKPYLQALFGQEASYFFRQSPAEKLNVIRNLQNQGRKVMMVGDGLNDAGALKQAEVGVAVTEDTSSFSPASDVILDARVLTQLPAFLQYTKDSRKILRNNLSVSLLYNVAGLSFALSGHLSPLVSAIFMPLSTITVVSLAVFQSRYRAHSLNSNLPE